MEGRQFKYIYGENPFPYFRIEQNGDIWRKKQEQWEVFPFNDLYKGYYPHTTFTELFHCRRGLFAAGYQDDGKPILYNSILGEVWERVNLKVSSPFLELQEPQGKICKILYENVNDQLFLLTSAGEIVTLPDCPKCVKIFRATESEILDGSMEEDVLRLVLKNGEMEVLIGNINQFRVSMEYAWKKVKETGILVDLRREEQVEKEGTLEGSISLNSDELEEFIKGKAKDDYLFFICSYGVQADQAVWYARSHGFTHAFSIGGYHTLLHA